MACQAHENRALEWVYVLELRTVCEGIETVEWISAKVSAPSIAGALLKAQDHAVQWFGPGSLARIVGIVKGTGYL